MLDVRKNENGPEGLADAIGSVRRRPLFPLVGMLVATIVMIVYLNMATYRYTASVKVTSAQASGSLPLSSSGLAGLASVASIRLPQSPGEQNLLVFTQNLVSPLSAEVLMRDPTIVRRVFDREWDAQRRVFREPHGFVGDSSKALKTLLGIPVQPYAPPNIARMKRLLEAELAVADDTRKPIVGIAYANPDPAFAKRLVTVLVRGVDDELRRRALARTKHNIAYLQRELAIAQLAESRAALASALASEERQRMSASQDAPYAGEPISDVGVSDRPTSPRPMIYLAGAALTGALAGAGVALFAASRQTTTAP